MDDELRHTKQACWRFVVKTPDALNSSVCSDHSHVINIIGDSYRLKEKKEAGLVDSELYKFQTKKSVKGVK